MHKNKKTRNILSYFLAFFLAAAIVAICMFVEAKIGLVGKRNFRDCLAESDYVRKTQSKVTLEVKNLLEQKKLDPSIAEQIVTYDAVYMDMINYVDAVYAGKKKNADASTFKEELSKAVYEYLEKNNAVISPNVDNVVNELTATAGSYYETYVMPEFVSTIYDYTNGLNKRFTIAGRVGAAVSLLILILLFCMYHYKHHAMKFVIFSGTTAVLVNGIIALRVGKGRYLEKLDVGPDYYLEFLNNMIAGCVKEAYMITAVCAGIVVVLFAASHYMRNSRH